MRLAAAEVLKALQQRCPMGEQPVWTWVPDTLQQEELRKLTGNR